MTQFEGIALIVGLCGGLCLSGYWLASLLESATSAERLAVSMLAGLSSMLLLVSAVNFFLPLAWPWVLICLIAPFATLLWPRSRHSLVADLIAFWRDPETRLVGVLLSLFFCLLLWPLLADSATVFYDGSPNHDSFFWISTAEYLKRHTYLMPVVKSQTQPLFSATQAVIGLTPDWGRMGAEGLLALTSSLAGTSPLKLYLYGTVALYLPWAAAVYLAAKTFFSNKLTILSLFALAVLQPLFVFYYANANLPNLLGMLTGAAAILATEQALRTPGKFAGSFGAWWALLVLSLHGLYCSYPEMIPFTGLSCTLLWIRAWFRRRTSEDRRSVLYVAAAAALSAVINPVTTLRAFHGFFSVLGIAQANQHHINIFSSLSLGEYVPALSTLDVPGARRLGDWIGAPLSLALLAGAGLALWRSRDRFGVFAILSGGGVLLIYTLATGFNYGWQKTVQFTGVFISLVVPVMAVDALWGSDPRPVFWRWLTRGSATLIGCFMLHATLRSGLDVHAWSKQKVISNDWFNLRDESRSRLRGAPVLVEAGTFRMAFFHGMWATYFLPESDVYFGARGEQSGGYLRGSVINEADHDIPAPSATLVGRDWAETFDANSPRLLTGREYALLTRSNRVLEMEGVFPLNGVPDVAANDFRLTLQPAVASELHLTLTARAKHELPVKAVWKIHRETGEGSLPLATLEGPPPWRFTVPLLTRQTQTLRFTQSEDVGAGDKYPFVLTDLAVRSSAAPLDPSGATVDFTQETAWQDYLPEGLAQASEEAGTIARVDGASLRFSAMETAADVALDLIAVPTHSANAAPPLPTELWFNDSLIFTGSFQGPGVLRVRIFAEHWNQRPIGTIRLGFPGNPEGGPQLILKQLSVRPDTSPRP